MQVIVRIYGDFDDFGRFWTMKNKPNSKPILFSPQIYSGGWKNKANFGESQKQKGKRKNESKFGISPDG